MDLVSQKVPKNPDSNDSSPISVSLKTKKLFKFFLHRTQPIIIFFATSISRYTACWWCHDTPHASTAIHHATSYSIILHHITEEGFAVDLVKGQPLFIALLPIMIHLACFYYLLGKMLARNHQ